MYLHEKAKKIGQVKKEDKNWKKKKIQALEAEE